MKCFFTKKIFYRRRAYYGNIGFNLYCRRYNHLSYWLHWIFDCGIQNRHPLGDLRAVVPSCPYCIRHPAFSGMQEMAGLSAGWICVDYRRDCLRQLRSLNSFFQKRSHSNTPRGKCRGACFYPWERRASAHLATQERDLPSHKL